MQRRCGFLQAARSQFGSRPSHLALKVIKVQCTSRQAQYIARIGPGQQTGWGAAGPMRLKYPAQSGNMSLNQVHRIPRRCLTPHGIDHLLSTDRPTRLERQHRQDHPLLNRSKIYDGLMTPDPKRTQHAKTQREGPRVIHIPSAAQRDLNQRISEAGSSDSLFQAVSHHKAGG
jgi:hypothetical protein